MELDYLLNNSLCKHCEHRVVRDISSEGLAILNEFDEPEFTTDDEGQLEDFIHISCSKLCIDLDHIVLDCNKFKETKTTKLVVKRTFIKSTAILNMIGANL